VKLSEYWKIRIAETVTCEKCWRIRGPWHWILRRLEICQEDFEW